MAAAEPPTVRPNSDLDPQELLALDEAGWDVPPKLIKGKSPIFPASLLLSGVSGEVVIHYTVGVDGKTKDFEVESAPNQKFADHAIIALKKWVFSPAMMDGKAVEARISQSFTFETD